MARTAPYSQLHADPQGPGDARPTALQVLQADNLLGALPHLTILITGGSAGIGLETVRAAYATGARVFFTARDLAKGEKIVTNIAGANSDSRLQLLHLDLASLDSVRHTAKTFLRHSNTLNILINNAALTTGTHNVNDNGVEAQFAANHVGPFLLFQLLKPTLLASSTPSFHSRVINVASVSHRTASSISFNDLALNNIDHVKDPLFGYSHSKLANIYMANALERRYGSRGLHAFSLQPGGVISDIFRERWDTDTVRRVYMESAGKHVKTPAQGAATTLWAAVGKVWEGKGGVYLENLAEVGEVQAPRDRWGDWWEPGYAPWAFDREAEERLWRLSSQLVGVEDTVQTRQDGE